MQNFLELSEGKKIDLPMWLAMRMNEFVKHEIPKQYRTRFQNILNADPEVVNLHKMGPKYYGMGLQVNFTKRSENQICIFHFSSQMNISILLIKTMF